MSSADDHLLPLVAAPPDQVLGENQSVLVVGCGPGSGPTLATAVSVNVGDALGLSVGFDTSNNWNSDTIAVPCTIEGFSGSTRLGFNRSSESVVVLNDGSMYWIDTDRFAGAIAPLARE